VDALLDLLGIPPRWPATDSAVLDAIGLGGKYRLASGRRVGVVRAAITLSRPSVSSQMPSSRRVRSADSSADRARRGFFGWSTSCSSLQKYWNRLASDQATAAASWLSKLCHSLLAAAQAVSSSSMVCR
jgi:hypothetical protein